MAARDMASAEAPAHLSRMDKAFQTFKTGLFGVLFVMAKDASMQRLFAIFMMVLDFLQMMSFPLSQSPTLPWQHSSVLSEFSSALSVLSVGRAISLMGAGVTLGSFYIALFWIFGLLGCAVWVGYSFARESFRVVWPIKLLRTTAQLSTTALFIPLVSVLTNIFRCPPGETWATTGWECWGGSHGVVATLVAILISLFAALSAIVVSVFFDRNPKSSHVTARPHGRVQVVMILIKATLTLVYTQDWWLSAWALAACSVFAGAVWVSAYSIYLPFFQQRTNQLQTSFGAVHLWAGLCLVLVLLTGLEHVESAAFAFLLGAPLVAFSGWAFSDMRWRAYDSVDDLNTAYTVELKARRMLSRMTQERRPGSGTVKPQDIAKVHPMEVSSDLDATEDEGIELLQDVEDLYKQGCEAMPTSSILRVFAAQFFSAYRANRHLEVQMLASAESLSPSPDEAFIIFQRRRQVQDNDDTSGGQKMNVIARVRFEKYRVESQESGFRARERQVEFWAELLHKQPDIGKLNAIAGEITDSTARADAAFTQLLAINPRSIQTLRSYAQFLLEVTNNPSKANRLLEEAESIEDEVSKAHAERGNSVVFLSQDVSINASSENVAVITVSQDPRTMGEILTSNPQALKLFGYTRREMVGRTIDSLLPEPVASFHQRILRQYLSSGKAAVMNTSRVMFGLHRAGHVFPLVLNVRAMDSGFGGLMQPINSDERFILFMSKSLRITAACQESLLLLGLSPEELKSRAVSVDRYFAGIKVALGSQNQAQGLEAAAEAAASGDAEELGRASAAAKVMTASATGASAPKYKLELRRVSKGYMGAMGGASGSAAATKQRAGSKSRAAVPGRRAPLFASCQLQITPITMGFRQFDSSHGAKGNGSMRGFWRTGFDEDYCVVMRWRRHIDDAGSSSGKDKQAAGTRRAGLLASGQEGGASVAGSERGSKRSLVLSAHRPSVTAGPRSSLGSAAAAGVGLDGDGARGLLVGSPVAKARRMRSDLRRSGSFGAAKRSSVPAADSLIRRSVSKSDRQGHPAAQGGSGSGSGHLLSSFRDKDDSDEDAASAAAAAAAAPVDADADDDDDDDDGDGGDGDDGRGGGGGPASPARKQRYRGGSGSPPPSSPQMRHSPVDEEGLDCPRGQLPDDLGESLNGSLGQGVAMVVEEGSSSRSIDQGAPAEADTAAAAAKAASKASATSSGSAGNAAAAKDTPGGDSSADDKARPHDTRQSLASVAGSGDVPPVVGGEGRGCADDPGALCNTLGSDNGVIVVAEQDSRGELSAEGSPLKRHASLSETGIAMRSPDTRPRPAHAGTVSLVPTSGSVARDGADRDGDSKVVPASLMAGGLAAPQKAFPSSEMASPTRRKGGLRKSASPSPPPPARGDAPASPDAGPAPLLSLGEANPSGSTHRVTLALSVDQPLPERRSRANTDDSSDRGSSAGGSSFGGSSHGSASSRSSAMTQLRRSLTWQSNHTEPGLWRLRQAIFYIFAVFGIINVATTIVSREIFNGYLYDVSQVADSGLRLVEFSHILLGMQSLLLMGTHAVPATPGQFNLTLATVAQSVDLFAEVHDRLYVSAAADGDPQLTDLYSGVVPPFIDLVPFHSGQDGGAGRADSGEVVHIGLLDAGKKVVTKATSAFKSPQAAWDTSVANNSDVHFVLVNGPTSILSALNASAWISQYRTNSIFAFMTDVRVVMMYVTCGLVIFMGLAIIVPITRQVEHSKDEIFKVFLDVPTVVLRALKAQAHKRLGKLVREMEDDDAGMSDDEDDAEATDAITNVDWSKIDLKVRKRRYHKGMGVLCALLARFLLPLAVGLGYYTGLFLWERVAADLVVHDGEGILHTVTRTAQLSRTLFHTTAFSAERNVTEATAMLETARSALGAFSDLHHDLMYGNDARFIRNFIVLSEPQRRLMLENGCIAMSNPSPAEQMQLLSTLSRPDDGIFLSPSLEEVNFPGGRFYLTPKQLSKQAICLKFGYELLADGLHQGVIRFLSVIDELITERAAELQHLRDAGVEMESEAVAARRLADFRLRMVRTLGVVYVGAGLEESTEVHYRHVTAAIAEFQLIHTLATAASIVALVFFYVVVYQTTINQLDVEMKRTRGMLLLFPEHIIRSVPAIRGVIAQFSQTLGIARRPGRGR
ncbi:hypothetical protein FNF29_03846 [Cafeteria roenbergensis]|uniref:PAS domain-containing protein n=1 Tax=Cafeteria roenbergensis TaxID=33653 RepID=A0A5A8CIZ9_CAFRO|nr:hypothetical protein FNF29_03846 [Cafeteria roenbergensis]|eukprot:KAA0152619.1 hypothetical protein FNF29_03846 [Cafeteria roenbergensis]